MERVRIYAKYALMVLSGLLIYSCDDPALLLQQLEEDVMIANSLFLEIESISPAEGATAIDPGSDIVVKFDRPIDDSNLSAIIEVVDNDGVSFEDNDHSLSFSYDSSSYTLTISPEPYFQGLKTYTVRFKDQLSGVDGSSLNNNEFQWKFSTKDVPIGTIRIVEDYTNQGSVDVSVKSQGATFYAISNDRADLEDPATANWQAISAAQIDVAGEAINTTEGEQVLYIVFRDGTVSEALSANLSRIVQDSVIYDVTPPIVDPGSGTFYINQYNTSPQITGSASDGLSGIASVSWSQENGSGTVSFGNSSALSTSISYSTEVDICTVKLTVTDGAGNTSDMVDPTIGRRNVILDISPPGTPTITPPPSPNDETRPTFGFSPGSDGTSYRYRIENGTWIYTSSPSASPTVSYGLIELDLECRDDAGNWSPTASQDIVVYPPFVSSGKYSGPSYSPSNGATISGDLAWTYSAGKAYRVSIGTSAHNLSLDVITITDDEKPYVDSTDLPKMLLGATYYWKVEYGTIDRGIFTSDYVSTVMSFRTSINRF